MIPRFVVTLVLVASLTGCHPCSQPLQPSFCYSIDKEELAQLPSPFAPLTGDEKQEDWAKEYYIGQAFGRDLDLYRAITSFKRALALLPKKDATREQEIDYFIALSYYLGNRYQDTIDTICTTPLNKVTPAFAAYNELLVFLYDSYLKLNKPLAADSILRKLNKQDTATTNQLILSAAVQSGDVERLCQIDSVLHDPDIQRVIYDYSYGLKSPAKAQMLSSVVPGLGYWYIGMRSTALTAFVVNALFIVATWQLFRAGFWPLGIFTTSLEFGWYFGNIYGSGQSAHLHNQLIYERIASKTLRDKRLHPVLMLKWGF